MITTCDFLNRRHRLIVTALSSLSRGASLREDVVRCRERVIGGGDTLLWAHDESVAHAAESCVLLVSLLSRNARELVEHS